MRIAHIMSAVEEKTRSGRIVDTTYFLPDWAD
jgi:hypothetical protein